MRKIRSIFYCTLLVVLGFLALIWLAILIPPVNHYMVDQFLSHTIDRSTMPVDVRLGRISFDLLGRISLHDLLVYDKKGKDTLVYARRVDVGIDRSDLLFSFAFHPKRVDLMDVRVHLDKHLFEPSADTSKTTADWWTAIPPSLKLITMSRLFLDIHHPSVEGTFRSLYMEAGLNSLKPKATLFSLFQKLKIESPKIDIFKYGNTQKAEAVVADSLTISGIGHTIEQIKRGVSQYLPHVEDWQQQALVNIQNLSCSDHTKSRLINLRAVHVENNNHLQTPQLQLGGKFNRVPFSLDVQKEPGLLQRYTYRLMVGASLLEGGSIFYQQPKGKFVWMIDLHKMHLDPSLAQYFLSSDLSTIPLKNIGASGNIYLSTDSLSVQLHHSNSKQVDYTLRARHLKSTNQLFIDTLYFKMSQDFLGDVQSYLLSRYAPSQIPYNIQKMGSAGLRGCIEEDHNRIDLSVDIDTLQCVPQDTMFSVLEMQGIHLNLHKNRDQYLGLEILQTNQRLRLGTSVFGGTNFIYKQHQQRRIPDTISFQANHSTADDRSFLVTAVRNKTDEKNEVMKINARLNHLRINDFYRMPNQPLQSTELTADVATSFKQGTLTKDIKATFSNVMLASKQQSLPFKEIGVYAQLDQGKDFFSLNVDGDRYNLWLNAISLEKVANRIQYQYRHILKESTPSAIENMKEGELFEFSFHTQNLSSIIHFMGYDDVDVDRADGFIRSSGYDLSSRLQINQFAYHSYTFSMVDINYVGDQYKIKLEGEIEGTYDDEFLIGNMSHFLVSSDDRKTIVIDVNTNLDNEDKKLTMRCALKDFDNDITYLQMEEFKLQLGDDNDWELQKKKLKSTSGFPERFTIAHKNQRLMCLPLYYRDKEAFNISLDVDNIGLDVLNKPIFEPAFHADGDLSLHIKILNSLSDLTISSYGVIKDFKFNGASFGDLNINQSFKDEKMKLTAYSSSGDRLSMNSTFNFSSALKFDMSLDIRDIPMQFLNYYLNPTLREIKGTVNGKIRISLNGEEDDLQFRGKANVQTGSFLIDYNQCAYNLKDMDVYFYGNSIEVKKGRLHDVSKKNSFGDLDMHITQSHSFDSLDAHVNIVANNLHVYNTTILDYDNYRLSSYGTGKFTLDKKRQYIDIACDMEVSDSSELIVRSSPIEKVETAFDGKQIAIRRYVPKDSTVRHEETQPLLDDEYITFNGKFLVSDKLHVLFYASNDDDEAIKVRGQGLLRVSSVLGELDMRGDVELTDLEPINMGYLRIYLSQEKPSFINFDGGADALLNVHTYSFIRNVDFSPIYRSIESSAESLNTTNFSNNASLYRSDLNLSIDVGGRLSSPKVLFDPVLPSTSPLLASQNMRLFLNRFHMDPLFANKQVGYLILFNQFMGENENIQGTLSQNTTLVAGALSSVTTYLLDRSIGRSLIQKTIDRILPGQNISFNINSNIGTSSSSSGATSVVDKGNVNLSISKPFFSNRLTLSVGSSFDYISGVAGATQTSSSSQFYTSPSFNARWKVSEQSNIFLGGYYKNAVNYEERYLNQQNSSNIAGLNIGFSKEFNSFAELFSKKKRMATDSTKRH